MTDIGALLLIGFGGFVGGSVIIFNETFHLGVKLILL